MNMHSHRITIAWNWIQHVSETLEWNWSMITSWEFMGHYVLSWNRDGSFPAAKVDCYHHGCLCNDKANCNSVIMRSGWPAVWWIHEINPKVLMLQASALWTYSSLTTIHFHSQMCLSCIPCTITPLRIIVSWPLMTTQQVTLEMHPPASQPVQTLVTFTGFWHVAT